MICFRKAQLDVLPPGNVRALAIIFAAVLIRHFNILVINVGTKIFVQPLVSNVRGRSSKVRRSRLQVCLHFVGKSNTVIEQLEVPLRASLFQYSTTGGTKIPAVLNLGSCKLHLEKRKGNNSFSKANIINAKKNRCQKERKTERKFKNQHRVDASSVLNEVKNNLGLGRAFSLHGAPAGKLHSVLRFRSVKNSHKCGPIPRYNGREGSFTTYTECCSRTE